MLVIADVVTNQFLVLGIDKIGENCNIIKKNKGE
jgi:hypothetical protein